MPDLIKRANMSMMCTSYLNRETEEKRNFEFSWVEEKIDNDPTPSPWVYVNADRSETISMAGKFYLYIKYTLTYLASIMLP